ncbi:MAG: SOS response-associated peptidase [Chloroflexi bacterium]|nr:SOS response-associated peptidase [Chloroflexota bacterium]
MCGRYTLITSVAELEERFRFTADGIDLAPNYNVAPSQSALTIVEADPARRVGRLMRWGLIPSWARDISIGNRMINARSETVAEKPGFRAALNKRRCLVPADGFYEWQKVGRNKRPMRITLASGEPFAFAGLWETWNTPSGGTVQSFTILTTSANETLAHIHNRMPVILRRDAEEIWLDHTVQDRELLSGLFAPYDPSETVAYEVSTLVNSVANNVPEVITPVA